MTYLEDEIREVLRAKGAKRLDMIMSRLGLDGQPPKTLQVVGDRFGVTRERVRQIQQQAKKRLSAGTLPMMPVLAEALAALEEVAPCTPEHVQQVLADAELSGGKVSGEGLLEAATFFMREAPIAVVRVGDKKLFIECNMTECFAKAPQVARKLVCSHGVATVAEVAEGLGDGDLEHGEEQHEAVVRLALDAECSVVWLDTKKRWLWLSDIPDGRNRLLNNIAKVLSVAGRISAVDLRRAVRRDWRMGGYAPPAAVLLALADAVPNLARDGDLIEPIEPLRRDDCLSNSEYVIAEVLLENGSVMHYPLLQRTVLEYGVGSAAFKQRMYSSPIVRKYAPGVYGLSGCDAAPSAVEALVGRGARSRVLQDCGWTDDGCLWIAYKLNPTTLDVAVLGIPGPVREFVVGEHVLRDASDREVGTFVAKDYAAWGVRRFLRLSGAEEGDTLLLVFDLSTRICHAYLGDESVRDEILAAD